MSRNLRSNNASCTILVVDALEFRRSSMASLLKPWARDSNINIVEIDPAGALAQPEFSATKLILLVIGSQSIADAGRLEWVQSLRVKYANAPLVFVAECEQPRDVFAAFDCGARGFIPMSVAPQIAVAAIQFIMGGGSFFPPAVLESPPIQPSVNVHVLKTTVIAEAQTSGLTVRQEEVLERLRHGESNKLIATRLNVEESTIKVHIRQIMRKLGARNRTQAALSAEQFVASKKEQGGA